MLENPVAKPRRMSGFECLPSSVITENILTRLPLPEAVRTSLLSREWRHRWKTIPRLEFSWDTLRSCNRRRVSRAINRTLSLHVGPIREFVLSYALMPCTNVDPWIGVLSRKGVKKVVLRFAGQTYSLPSSLYDCGALVSLQLLGCSLHPPCTFQGFRDLSTLDLRYILCTGDDLGRLISSCPVLGDLSLSMILVRGNLRVCTPNLRRFSVSGSFTHLLFENTPLLQYAQFGGPFIVDPRGLPVQDRDSMVRLFTPLASIQELKMKPGFLKHLSMGNIPERLPAPRCHLRVLSLNIGLRDLKQTMVAVCLLKSCPILEILNIDNYLGCKVSIPISGFWETECLNCSFDHLRIVVLATISDVPEMAFAKFMLANSPVLEKLNIGLSKDVSEDAHKFRMVTKDLLSFPRSSKEARILLQN